MSSFLPQHVVIVPDGNRRWAREKGKPASFGHREGAKAMEPVLTAAQDLGIPYVTVWMCSVSNVTNRSRAEVGFLYALFERYFKKMAKSSRLRRDGIRVRVLGRWKEFFPLSLRRIIERITKDTVSHDKFHLTFLMAYSGTDEMLHAVGEVAHEAGKREIGITEQTLKSHLWTKDLPPVDLVIRTGGEPHWSQGLLMWDVAESQLHFTKTFWPAFSPEEFQRAITSYGVTERRKGA